MAFFFYVMSLCFNKLNIRAEIFQIYKKYINNDITLQKMLSLFLNIY